MGTSLVAQTVKRLPAMQETWVRSLGWRRKWQPTPVLLPGKFCGWRSLTVHRVTKSHDWATSLSFFLAGWALRESRFACQGWHPRACGQFMRTTKENCGTGAVAIALWSWRHACVSHRRPQSHKKPFRFHNCTLNPTPAPWDPSLQPTSSSIWLPCSAPSTPWGKSFISGKQSSPVPCSPQKSAEPLVEAEAYRG